jgi:hypothetical protein
VDQLREEVWKVYQAKQGQVLPYRFFLRELGLKKSTPSH